MNFRQEKNTKILRRVTNRTGNKRPVPFDCLVKVSSDKSKLRKKKNSDKLQYDASLNFPMGIENSKLTLKSGIYFLNDKFNDELASGETKNFIKHEGDTNREENGIFVWNPSRKRILPILGVVMAFGKLSKLKDKILIFKRKRRLKRRNSKLIN
ncbi:hypothetical protein RUM44_010953 [Polyplax serrata]|uniref:Uncharacterized protein n=1 Tax=Polyplax serrata TaxID=468196 RepID=A0ABR1ANN3_POLSC